jgi:hypothetical protein
LGGRVFFSGRRASVLKMLDDHSRKHVDPKFWAPFLVVGDLH